MILSWFCIIKNWVDTLNEYGVRRQLQLGGRSWSEIGAILSADTLMADAQPLF